MQIIPFLPHYQLVCNNFDFSSFSLISCRRKVAVLHGKSVDFVSQKSRFRNTKLKLLIFNRKYLYKDEKDFLTITFGNQSRIDVSQNLFYSYSVLK